MPHAMPDPDAPADEPGDGEPAARARGEQPRVDLALQGGV